MPLMDQGLSQNGTQQLCSASYADHAAYAAIARQRHHKHGHPVVAVSWILIAHDSIQPWGRNIARPWQLTLIGQHSLSLPANSVAVSTFPAASCSKDGAAVSSLPEATSHWSCWVATVPV